MNKSEGRLGTVRAFLGPRSAQESPNENESESESEAAPCCAKLAVLCGGARYTIQPPAFSPSTARK